MKLDQISWIPIILLMVIIFYFSSKPAVTSEESSMTIANGILNAYENITDNQLQGEEKAEILGLIDHVVRKSAHFFEYALLACTFAFHFWVRRKKTFHIFLYSVVLTALYSATDEFHQLFVPGRSGLIKDVLLDTSGAATGAFLFCLVTVLLLESKKRKQSDMITSQK